MDTGKLKVFAQKARKQLIAGVEKRLMYWGFDMEGKTTEKPEPVQGGYIFREQVFDDVTVPKKWRNLLSAVKRHSLKDIAEEAAYTWFNRFIAVKILEENGFGRPVLEFDKNGSRTPLILQDARRLKPLFMDNKEYEQNKKIFVDYANEEKAFGFLITAYCRKHRLLEQVFGTPDDYTELLLPDDMLVEDGFLDMLNNGNAISGDDFKEIELIGWLYQFYISEKKDEVFTGFKKNKKARPEDIPAATQIFTPKWIVKYMCENTVGRIWLDRHPESPLRKEMKYLVEPSDGNYKSEQGLIDEAADLRLLDPACGSGHILLVGFDLLLKMHKEEGYSTKEAVESILKKNLFGLEIDKRAAQLARFAMLLKAASYYPEILKKNIFPNIYAMPEPRDFSPQEIYNFLGDDGKPYVYETKNALLEMKEAQNIGSALKLRLSDEARDHIKKRYIMLLEKYQSGGLNFNQQAHFADIHPFIIIMLILTDRFHAVVANPPYLNTNNMNEELRKYVAKYYPHSKSDLFGIFLEVCLKFTTSKGLMGMINQQSWMFLSSFKELRERIITHHTIENMVHLGPKAFEESSGEKVQSTAFVIANYKKKERKADYYRLIEYKDTYEKEKNFIRRNNLFKDIIQSRFSKIPGNPIAYWVSNTYIHLFESYPPLIKTFQTRLGMSTANNDRFVRHWHEVSIKKVNFSAKNRNEALNSNLKWFPYQKGGRNKRWYGNNEYLVNWENDGEEIKNYGKESGRIRSHNYNLNYIFKEGISWSDVTSGKYYFRYMLSGFLFDGRGSAGFLNNSKELYEYLGLLNSKISYEIINIINPTITVNVGEIGKIPFHENIKENTYNIKRIVTSCINISKTDWDIRENSWDFQLNPLIQQKEQTLESSYEKWKQSVTNDFFQLHQNEEEINRIFIDIYGFQEELTTEVPLKDITIFQEKIDRKKLETLEKTFRENGKDSIELPIKKNVVMQQLISYAIGCFMGRYRLDKPGLHIAHPNSTDEEVAEYKVSSPFHNSKEEKVFKIDDDAIIPMMGSDCSFSDDVVFRVKEFIEIIWGPETVTENINFIEKCLDKNIEKYLVNDSWKYHCKTYKKKPIYWLFQSPKGAFKVQVYMHRMNRFTIQKIRHNYMLPHLKYLKSRIEEIKSREYKLSSTENRQLSKLINDEIECREYEKLLKDFADRQIEFDLDDGVTVNHAKFREITAPLK